MHKSVNLYFTNQLDTLTKLRMIQQAGYDEFFTGIADQQETLTWREQLVAAKQLGLSLTMIHCRYEEPKLDYFWQDHPIGEQVCEDYVQQILACGAYTKNFVVHLHGSRNCQPSQFGLTRLRRLLQACEKFQLNLCVENLYSSVELPYIFKHIKHPLLKVCYDLGHQNWLTPDFDVVKNFHEVITVLHIHENDGLSDAHRPLTVGSQVYQRFQTDLALLDPHVVLASEIKCRGTVPPDYLTQNLAALNALQVR